MTARTCPPCSQTPTYRLEADPSGAKDTCILRFQGGPPYEDLAFKIVNREWETSHKRGFKCRFERGILQCAALTPAPPMLLIPPEA